MKERPPLGKVELGFMLFFGLWTLVAVIGVLYSLVRPPAGTPVPRISQKAR
jgi:hypothetical protein